jgi:hypothetical protein
MSDGVNNDPIGPLNPALTGAGTNLYNQNGGALTNNSFILNSYGATFTNAGMGTVFTNQNGGLVNGVGTQALNGNLTPNLATEIVNGSGATYNNSSFARTQLDQGAALINNGMGSNLNNNTGGVIIISGGGKFAEQSERRDADQRCL